MEKDPKLIEWGRSIALEAFKNGAAIGQRHAELLDEVTIERVAEVYAAEFEDGLGGA